MPDDTERRNALIAAPPATAKELRDQAGASKPLSRTDIVSDLIDKVYDENNHDMVKVLLSKDDEGCYSKKRKGDTWIVTEWVMQKAKSLGNSNPIKGLDHVEIRHHVAVVIRRWGKPKQNGSNTEGNDEAPDQTEGPLA
jgi:hypothetical protein